MLNLFPFFQSRSISSLGIAIQVLPDQFCIFVSLHFKGRTGVVDLIVFFTLKVHVQPFPPFQHISKFFVPLYFHDYLFNAICSVHLIPLGSSFCNIFYFFVFLKREQVWWRRGLDPALKRLDCLCSSSSAS